MALKVIKASVNAGGVVGENTIWDGPLSQLGRPHGKGSSSGSKGMKLKLADCGCDSLKGPITQIAKG
tara:strand:- start:1051 stop:1251 length:201 start_codon:yes stop_codon:yes gene_type:complete